ncbi:MAG: DUF1592 domain-containing protein [Fuerstiella sp.]|nr:DUF1592 domain-containing protein [Fuerstiella sp.]
MKGVLVNKRCFPMWGGESGLVRTVAGLLLASVLCNGGLILADERNAAAADAEYRTSIRPLLDRYCFECHADSVTEAEIDLGAIKTLPQARENVQAWVKVRDTFDTQQMPPKNSRQPTEAEATQLRTWVRGFLATEAKAQAGDPGPVVLRRLSNAEYTYTIRDLTGVSSLDPTDEFPIDGAAGEGFTNVGSGLVMSPSLVQKYLDAAKGIAKHAALFPDGIRFTPFQSRRDNTDDLMARIREFYARYTTGSSGTSVNLQGIRFETNQGGVLPIADYIAATVTEREAIRAGTKTAADVARETGLSPVYLETLWRTLNDRKKPDSFLLQQLCDRWQRAEADDVAALVKYIAKWQPLLWKFNVVGHLGREGAPQAWMEPIAPVTERQEFRLKLPAAVNGEDVVVYLSAGDAGDGHDNDFVLWRDMRLEAAGQPTVSLRDARGTFERVRQLRQEALAETAKYLSAAADLTDDADVVHIAGKYSVKHELLQAWLNYLAIGGAVEVQGRFTEKFFKASNYEFVNGWHKGGLPSLMANSSDQQVRIPGISRPHGLVVHPTPTEFVAIGWRSPIDGVVQVEASLSDAHPECGNGVEWFVQHSTAQSMSTLMKGEIPVAGTATMPPRSVAVGKGELISLIIGPRDASHSCDLTAIDLTVTETTGEKRIWDAGKDNTADIGAGNPHADQFGNNDVWHFYHGAMSGRETKESKKTVVPAGSLLARWIAEADSGKRSALAEQVAALATGVPPSDDQKNSPDGVLFQQLRNFAVPLDGELMKDVTADPRFGTHPLGHATDPNHLVVQAPATIEFRIPAEIAAGRELVVAGMYDVGHGREGTTQLHVGTTPSADQGLLGNTVICVDGSEARKRVENALTEFRELFPIAMCYTRIVPVDEVVTAMLFYREDDLFKRLMLDKAQVAQLDRLWDELLYVSEEPLKMVVSLEQIREFSTQDRQDLVGPWDKMRPLVLARAEAFRKRVIETEPTHLESVLRFVGRAWRRPLTDIEQQSLRNLYRQLRDTELAHEEAIRLVIARGLTSPAFLYRLETPASGSGAAPVTDLQLANRLSYFLWSSMPDDELGAVAEAGRLVAEDGELLRQTRRMLRHARTRRVAVHFACQWLHLRDFDQNDDKNEKLYPEFAGLRGDMYEETVRFFEDMFRNNGSILDLLNADHTFLNESLAKHYGIDGVTGSEWQRVPGMRGRQRGGILAMATFLASQSGASRTSPILRGNWVSETLLGEPLPRPPVGVPLLPETVPTGLTARQLIEQHSSDPACAKCHARIDPYGFALEQYDAVGRVRSDDADTRTTLFEGQTIDGLDGLRDYLATERRDDVVRNFCRKLLGFALGREVQLSDEPLIDDMLKKLNSSDHQFHVAVESVVLSKQFREIRGHNNEN